MATAYGFCPWCGRQRAMPLVVLLALVWLMLHPAPAFAHAEYDHSSPTAGAVLASPPARVDIWFTEHLTPNVSTIQVYDAERHRVDRNDTQIDPANTLHMSVTLEPLPTGLYTVVWANVSADDGHANRGGFAFTVLTPTPTPAAALAEAGPGPGAVATAQPTAAPPPLPLPSESAQEVADLLNPATDRPTAAVDLAGGWLTFSALVLAGGGALFALLCLLPALAHLRADGAIPAARLQRRFAMLTLLCALIGALAAFVSLLTKAEIATGLPPADLLSGAVLGPLLQVWSGRVWVFREIAFAGMAIAAVAGVLLWPRRVGAPATGTPTVQRRWRTGVGQRLLLLLIVILGGAGLIFQALDSHLAAGHVARQGPFATADLSLHLLAVGAWVGGLGYAALLLWPVWRELSDEARSTIATIALARFSSLALPSVAVIVLTGTYAAILLLPSLTDLLTSAYGQALDVKLALLLVLISFGAANRRTLARLARPRQPGPTEDEPIPGPPRVTLGGGLRIGAAAQAGRRLVRAMRLEFTVAALVLLAAGTMLEVGPPGAPLAAGAVKLDDVVTLAALPVSPTPSPPTPTPRPTPTPAGYKHTETAGDLTLALTVDPAVAGATSAFQVQARRTDGAAMTNAEVKLRLTSEAIDLGTQVLAAAGAGPGMYRVVAPALAVPGPWQIILNVRRDNVPEVDATFMVPVQSPASPLPPATPTANAPEPRATVADTLHAKLAFQPDVPAVGVVPATLRLTDGEGAPLSGAQAQVVWLMPEHAHLTESTLLPAGAPGVYTGPVNLSMAGAWLANVTLGLPDGRSTRLQFNFNVRERGLFGTIGEHTDAVATVPPVTTPAPSASAIGSVAVVAATTAAMSTGGAATVTPMAVTPGPPATPPPPVAPTQTGTNAAPNGLTQQGQVGDLVASVTLLPNIFTPAQVTVQMNDRTGAPADDAKRVDVQVAMQDMAHGARGITLTRIAPGRYQGQGMLLAMQGAWWLALRIERGDGRLQSGLFSFQVPADQPNGAVSALADRPTSGTDVIDIAVYPGLVDPAQIAVTAGRPVHLQVLYVDQPACGPEVRFDAAALRATVSADGVADLTFTPTQTGQVQLVCTPTGLTVQAGASATPLP